MTEEPTVQVTPGSVYAKTVDDALASEMAAKASLEQRGIGVVTTSSALATLLFAVAAFGTTAGTRLEPPAEGFLVTALVFFVLAAIGGLFVNTPMRYGAPLMSDLQIWVADATDWKNGDPNDAARIVAKKKVTSIDVARVSNGSKALGLYVATILQVVAVTCVAASIAIQLERLGQGVALTIVIILTVAALAIAFTKAGPSLRKQINARPKESA
jgi:hypothetical protein